MDGKVKIYNDKRKKWNSWEASTVVSGNKLIAYASSKEQAIMRLIFERDKLIKKFNEIDLKNFEEVEESEVFK